MVGPNPRRNGCSKLPRMVLFEDITLKPPSGEIPKVPVSVHPFFDE